MAEPRRRFRWLNELSTRLVSRGIPLWDFIMVGLAVVDVAALLLRRELLLPERWDEYVILFDRAVVGVFIAEFVISAARAEHVGRFVKANWYDIVGMVPLPIAFLRGFRLLRVPHVLLWGSRYPGVAERRYGGAYALAVFRQYEPQIVEDLTEPVLARLLQVLRDAVAKGRYAQAFGENLDQRRDRIHAVVVRALAEKPALRSALALPGAAGAMKRAEDALVDVVVAALTDPELDAVLKESMDEALAELQARVASRRAGAQG